MTQCTSIFKKFSVHWISNVWWGIYRIYFSETIKPMEIKRYGQRFVSSLETNGEPRCVQTSCTLEP